MIIVHLGVLVQINVSIFFLSSSVNKESSTLKVQSSSFVDGKVEGHLLSWTVDDVKSE